MCSLRILTLKIHWFNSLQSSLRSLRDWGLKQLRRNAYMCVNFKLEYILTLRHNRSRADLINLAYFFSLWCLRKMSVIDYSGAYDMCYLCILTLKIHWFNSLQSSIQSFRDWGLRRNAYMCVNFKLEYILTLRYNRSRADLINLAYFLSL